MLAVSFAGYLMEITFGQWLKFMRTRSDISQGEIAQDLGVKVQTVGNWEAGRSNPSLNPDQTFKLCQKLDVSLELLAKAYRGEIEIED